MSDPRTHPVPGPDPDAVRRRDHGLRRASNATRWSFAAAAAGTAALGLTYLHLLPGSAMRASAPAPAQAGQPAVGWTCTTTTALASTPAQVRQAGDEHQNGESDDHTRAPAPTPITTCVSKAVGPGLTPPGQAPAATQQAPQTRTGAS
jgi:hypothetical protein